MAAAVASTDCWPLTHMLTSCISLSRQALTAEWIYCFINRLRAFLGLLSKERGQFGMKLPFNTVIASGWHAVGDFGITGHRFRAYKI
jgi:hypothetical protein